ncbi:MAG: DUF2103 domain-containing protein [Halobacteriaceae archaeon]
MECRRCGSRLERPGDYCLVCRSANADGVVVDADADRATLTVLDGESTVGTTTVTTTAEGEHGDGAAGELVTAQRRNFVGRIVDEVRRKRPDAVYAAGERSVVRALAGHLRYDLFRVPDEDPVAEALERRGERALAVVEDPPAEKIGGAHSTLIGGRTGRRAVHTVAGHPHVKKVVPGPISSGGGGARGGLTAKVTRADEGGNVRLLLRDGSTVQENRVVTTAPDRELGERVRDDLAETLVEEGLARE